MTSKAATPTDAPLILCGMHRSGTSLLASLLIGSGVDLGTTLLGAAPGNPHGHFEDLDFLRFHERALVANGIVSEGFTIQREVSVPARLQEDADRLVAARCPRHHLWGWKDPRSTLFLDFWKERLPNARVVAMFRRPWEVVDSLYRRTDPTFHDNPSFALDVWMHYNRLVLAYARRHPATTLLCEAASAVNDPAIVFAAIYEKFGLDIGPPPQLCDESVYHQGSTARRAALLKAACPAAHELYTELRIAAGKCVGPKVVETAGTGLQQHLLEEWARWAAPEPVTVATPDPIETPDVLPMRRPNWSRRRWPRLSRLSKALRMPRRRAA